MIGQGAYGIVYKGRKEDTGAIVAIKRIPFADSTPEGGVPCNVIREISLLRELDHPNVVRATFDRLVGPFRSFSFLLCSPTPISYIYLLCNVNNFKPGQTV